MLDPQDQRHAPGPGRPRSGLTTYSNAAVARQAAEVPTPSSAPPGRPQPLLDVSQPGDPLEREADEVAARVVARAPAPVAPTSSGRTGPGIGRASSAAAPAMTPSLQSYIAAASGGAPLPDGVRSRIEPHLGADLSPMRVHDGPGAAAAAAELNARAFTYRRDVFLGEGESATDVGLMAHEATHVVQQGAAGVQRSVGAAGLAPAGDLGVQRQDTAAPERTPGEVADDYEADALAYFEQHMAMELRGDVATEGAAIGRRAAHHISERIRQTCEPFERDQEIDTVVLNNVFAVAGGAANLTRGMAGGSSSSHRGINIGSRIVNIGINLLAVNLPLLAGYRTVGSLKDNAIRQLAAEAEQAGETSSAVYRDYEEAVMDGLRAEWETAVHGQRQRIAAAATAAEAAGMQTLGQALWSTERTRYQTRLREEYGARGDHGRAMITAISEVLDPRLEELARALTAAKERRELWQGLGAIGAGIAGGAAIGAAVGAPAGGIGAVPGAIVGGIAGGVVGLGGAIAIWWD